LLLLAGLATVLAATVVHGLQDGGPGADDLRSLSPAEQRQWIETRLAELEREQAELRRLLGKLDNGETIDAPYPLTPAAPGWTPPTVPGEEGLTPAPAEPTQEVRPSLPRDAAPGDWSALSREQRDSFHSLAKELAPEMSGELEELRQNEPERYEQLMNRNLPRLAEMKDLRRRDREVYRLRARDSELARTTTLLAAQAERARDAGDFEQAARHEDRLRQLLDEHFEVRQRIRSHELDRLNVRLRDLEEEFLLRAESKGELVEDRLNELLDRFEETGRNEG
jgi:hypothetical protein